MRNSANAPQKMSGFSDRSFRQHEVECGSGRIKILEFIKADVDGTGYGNTNKDAS